MTRRLFDAPLRQAPRPRSRGFTLTELMVVTVIVAILAAVGYPSYMDHLVRGHIASATTALGEMRNGMEQYYLSNRTYVGGPCGTSVTADSFTVACAGTGNPGANTYTLRATGSGLAADFVYTLDHHGTQGTTLPSGWGGGTYPCWVMRKGQTC